MAPYQKSRFNPLFTGNETEPQSGLPIDTTGLFDPGIFRGSIGVGAAPIVKPPTNPLNAPDSGLTALRGRARPYMEQLKAFYQSEPSRKDNQLSKWGKLLAASSGVIEGGLSKSPGRGIAIAKNIMDQPYEDAKSDWASKGGRLGQLANIEDTELKDQAQLEVKIAEDEAKRRDDLRQDMLAESTKNLNDSQIKDRNERAKILGLEYRNNDLTGYVDLYDLKTGTITPTKNKVKETPTEKGNREFEEWKKQNVIEQQGKERIIGLNFVNDKIMQGIKAEHDISMQGLKSNADERLAKLKSNLDRLSPDQRNKAFEGAYKEVLLMQPAMKNLLFDVDDKGNATIKKDYNPDVLGLFQSSVQELMKQRMGEPSSGMPTGGTFKGVDGSPSNPANMGAPDNSTQNPSIDPALRAQAVAWLSTNKDEQGNTYPTDDATIAEWVKQVQADPSLLKENPQVALPEQAAPSVTTPDVGLEAIKNIPGAIARNIYFGDYSQPHAPVQMTDPNSDTGLNTIGGLIDSIRNAPQNIYDPQNLARRRNRSR